MAVPQTAMQFAMQLPALRPKLQCNKLTACAMQAGTVRAQALCTCGRLAWILCEILGHSAQQLARSTFRTNAMQMHIDRVPGVALPPHVRAFKRRNNGRKALKLLEWELMQRNKCRKANKLLEWGTCATKQVPKPRLPPSSCPLAFHSYFKLHSSFTRPTQPISFRPRSSKICTDAPVNAVLLQRHPAPYMPDDEPVYACR